MTSYLFRKKERLCSKKTIGTIFERGNSFLVRPFRIVWTSCPKTNSDVPVKIVFSIPKHNLSKATQRNLVRRRIREAYRKNKNILSEHLQEKDQTLSVVIIYSSKDIMVYSEIEAKIILTLQRLKEEHEKHCT